MKPEPTKATLPHVTRWQIILVAIIIAALPSLARADERAETYAALHVQDVRLGAIAERLMAANAPLCRQTMPVTGMILHSADQYSDPLPAWFEQGNVAISSVIPQSAADEAGLQMNDALVAVNGVTLGGLAQIEGEPRRDTIFDWMAMAGGDGATLLTYRRGGEEMQAEIRARQGCYSLVEVLADNDDTARSNGKVIQISYGITSTLSDDQLAVVFAHELAHTVLEHRRRLSDAGVQGGLLGEFGRDRRIAREVEIEADLLSAHLLANAGYDPSIAPAFWRSDAGRVLGRGAFRSRRYPSRESRADMIEAEIAEYLQGVVDVSMAAHLLDKRDQPFTR